MKLLNEKASRGGSFGSSGAWLEELHCHGSGSLVLLLLAFLALYGRGMLTPWALPPLVPTLCLSILVLILLVVPTTTPLTVGWMG